MMTFASRYYSLRRQSGAASTAIAVLFLLILFAAVLAVTNMSGSSVVDAARQEQQTAALFLAESGVEAATATLNKANNEGTYGEATCKGLASGAKDLGLRGKFEITPSPTCVGDPSTCPECNVVVTGTINDTTVKRIIRTKIAVFSSGGTSKCDAKPILKLTSKEPGEGIFTNLAYRARDDGSMCGPGGGSNALIQTCDIVGTDSSGNPIVQPCSPNTEGWNLQRTGTNNVSGLGVFSNINLVPGSYTISQTLVDTSTHNPALRNYVGVGLLVEPDDTFTEAGKVTVGFVGSYGRDTGANKTTGTSSGPATGAIADGWNCAPLSGSANSTTAARANLLLYGFSSWPKATTSSAASSMILGGSHPLRRFANFANDAGSFPDKMYSQIWYSWNSAYAPSGVTARNGATFTGAVGAVVEGAIALTTLTVTSVTGGKRFGALRVGDAIAGTGVMAGTTIGTGGTGIGGIGTYTVSPSQTVKSTTLTVSSSILRVSDITGGQITVGDIVASGITGQPTVTAIVGGGRTSPDDNGDYTLNAAVSPVNTTTMQSSGTTIRLSGADPVAVGTVLGIAAGSGAFDSTAATGSISGTTLTVDNNCSPILVGDAVFGTNIKPPTRITNVVSCAGGAGTYTVDKSQTAASGIIYARAAVVSSSTTPPNPITTIIMSRRPARAIVGEQICGGVCAMLKHDGSPTQFELATTGASDDWASGFVCAQGADANTIKTLSIPIVKRASWSEPVQ